MKNLLLVSLVVVLAACGGSPQEATAPAQAPSPAQKAPDEDAAMAAIKQINEAQEAFFFRNRRYALTYDELKEGFFLREVPTTASTGYDIKLRPKADASAYTIVADPVPASSTAKHFVSDQTKEIRTEPAKD